MNLRNPEPRFPPWLPGVLWLVGLACALQGWLYGNFVRVWGKRLRDFLQECPW